MGFFGPCTLRLKLFIQDCWRNKYDWDVQLPPNFVALWTKLYLEATEILNVEIPRHLCDFPENAKALLHIFCDASKDAYACAPYLTFFDANSGFSNSALIYAKTRAAPKSQIQTKIVNLENTKPITCKELSIPRLGLMAVTIGKRAENFLVSKLDLKLDSTVIWTDATTILQWLNSATIQPKFVQNRLVEIRRTPNLFVQHVPTEQNPADIASRGSRTTNLSTLWWKGPMWLPHENL